MASTPTISAKIALEGAEQIKRQLDELGDAGEKAFNKILRASDKAGGFDKLNTADVQKQLDKLGVTGADAFGKIQKAVEDTARLEKWVDVVAKLENAFAKVGHGAMAAAKQLGPLAVAAVAVATAFIQASDAAQALVQSLNNTASAGNVSAQRFDALRRMANQAGISTEELTGMFQHLNENMDKVKADKLEKLRAS